MASLIEWVRLNWVLLAFIGGLAAAFLLLRTHPTAGIDDVQALDDVFITGQPVVVEFYSNFWSACLVAKPIVDGLEKQLAGKATVVRLDVMSKVGRAAAARYGVRGLPTLVLLDGAGQAVYSQAGIVRSGPVVTQVDTVLEMN
jgi:thioredoxin 1